jgi:hypothetical protein
MARGQAGSTSLAIMEVAAPITPCRHRAGSTVLDERGQVRARVSAATLGGDVGGTHQVSVPREPAMGADEPAPRGLGNPPPACWAGRRGASLVYKSHDDARLHSLVTERPCQMGAPPLPQAQDLDPAHVVVGDALGISDDQSADSVA